MPTLHHIPAWAWTTHDELKWLAELGSHLPGTNQHRRTRGELLHRYLRAPRADWGEVRASACLAYAQEQLTRLEEEGANAV